MGWHTNGRLLRVTRPIIPSDLGPTWPLPEFEAVSPSLLQPAAAVEVDAKEKVLYEDSFIITLFITLFLFLPVDFVVHRFGLSLNFS